MPRYTVAIPTTIYVTVDHPTEIDDDDDDLPDDWEDLLGDAVAEQHGVKYLEVDARNLGYDRAVIVDQDP